MSEHETTLTMYDHKGTEMGVVKVKIDYVEDGPSGIDVVHVNMQNAPVAGLDSHWIHCWDWVYNAATAWANDNASDLAAKARLEK